MTEYIKRSDAIMAITRAKLPDKTPEGVPIANGKRSVTDCVRRVKAIPAVDVVSGADFRDCRNELCLRCGNYTTKHLGSCDSCRWR